MQIKHMLTGALLKEVAGETLSDAYLSGANLSDADLSDANLSGADLSDANLRGADLRDANLRGAYLRDAYLSDANLRGADLSGANLSGADLSDAYLSDANLRGANLRGANLRGADLRGEKLKSTPVFISGMTWLVIVTNKFLIIGCKRYTHSEWGSFDDTTIACMEKRALEFWRQWKAPLLAICAAQAAIE